MLKGNPEGTGLYTIMLRIPAHTRIAAHVHQDDRGGRAGTFHLSDSGLGVPYTSAMVAGGVPLAVGLAYGKARRSEKGIVFSFLGDGALGEGAVQECFNIASLWRAPVLFVCENNARPDDGRANAFQAAPTLAGLAEVNGITSTSAL